MDFVFRDAGDANVWRVYYEIFSFVVGLNGHSASGVGNNDETLQSLWLPLTWTFTMLL